MSWTSGGIFDVEAKQARIAVIDHEMSAPTFWEDTRKAQTLVQERSDLARTVARFKDLAGEAEDLRVLWEMATEAGDEGEAAGI